MATQKGFLDVGILGISGVSIRLVPEGASQRVSGTASSTVTDASSLSRALPCYFFRLLMTHFCAWSTTLLAASPQLPPGVKPSVASLINGFHRANELFKKACAAGDARACREVQ